MTRGGARAEAWAGARDTLTTVVPSIVAYGVVWGGLARQAGLSLGELVAMCLLVTAGTAQFVALPMLQAGAPAWLLIVTTYIVNLRHYLMAASLAPYFAHLSRARLAVLAHGISDESYALTMARFARQAAHPAYFAGSRGVDLRRLVLRRRPSEGCSAAGFPIRTGTGSISCSRPSSSRSWRGRSRRHGNGRSPAWPRPWPSP